MSSHTLPHSSQSFVASVGSLLQVAVTIAVFRRDGMGRLSDLPKVTQLNQDLKFWFTVLFCHTTV